VVGQTGADFDIDTLYLMQYNLIRNGNELQIEDKHQDDRVAYKKYLSDLMPKNLFDISGNSINTEFDFDLDMFRGAYDFIKSVSDDAGDINIDATKFKSIEGNVKNAERLLHLDIKKVRGLYHMMSRKGDLNESHINNTMLDVVDRSKEKYNALIANHEATNIDKYSDHISKLEDYRIEIQKDKSITNKSAKKAILDNVDRFIKIYEFIEDVELLKLDITDHKGTI
jgi:hypothetical protein